MGRIVIIVAGAALAATLAVGFAVWRWLNTRNDGMKERRLMSNRHNQRRLQAVVSHLLAHADEVDQASKFVHVPLESEWNRRFSTVCTRLVQLSDTLELIQQKLEIRDPAGTQDDILRCARLASHLSGELRVLNHSVNIAQTPPQDLQTSDEVERH